LGLSGGDLGRDCLVSTREYWFSFSITPVKGFLRAAKTVRDRKNGSQLLSFLAKSAIDRGRAPDLGGELLFPMLEEDDTLNIPNQFVMTFPTCEGALAAAPRVEEVTRTAWIDLAARAHTEPNQRQLGARPMPLPARPAPDPGRDAAYPCG
jgi:hypothetical protein